MANVVLIFTGNVCSTPMVEFAHLTPRVFVPVREQFDPHKFFAYVTDEAKQAETLAQIMGAAFARDGAAYAQWPPFAEILPDGRMPDRATTPHTFFKWRTVDPDLPRTHLLREMFVAHDVAPVFMLRRSLAQQALKVQLSEMVYGGRHQQFKVSNMKADAYAAYLNEQAAIRLTLGPEDIDAVEKTARMFLTRTRRLEEYRDFYFPHAGKRAVIAEDIFRPEIDLDRYEATLERLFGEAIAIPRAADAPIRKGGLEIEHCANAEEVLADPRLVALERKYEALVQTLERVSPG